VAIVNAANLSAGVIIGNVQQRLIALRAALDAVADLHQWAAGIAAADLEAVGVSATDAPVILSAIADAAALESIYSTGLPPGTYPQPASAYVYAASQRQVIGPQ